MKPQIQRLFALLLIFAMTLSLLCGGALAANVEAADKQTSSTGDTALSLQGDAIPYSISNVNAQNYDDYGPAVTTHLITEGSGYTSVNYIKGRIAIERLDSSFKVLSTKWVPAELLTYGGFFPGRNYNYLFFGQNNYAEKDNFEVLRVVKYDKNWNRVGHASIYGENTVCPFIYGSLRAEEYGDFLYVRTCHLMYKTEDNHNHQANLTFELRQSTMNITDINSDITDNSKVKVSADGKVTVPKNYVGKVDLTITAKGGVYKTVNKTVSLTVTPSVPTFSGVSDGKKGKLLVKWKKNTTCDSYQVQYSTDKAFEQGVTTKTVSGSSTVSAAYGGLTKGKTYYVRIRGAKTASGKTLNSAWSAVKTVKLQ